MNTHHEPGTPVPARITLALNAGDHSGPDVDLAVDTWEGNPDGDVDAWEAGTAVPTPEQVQLLAELTGATARWFYLPLVEGPLWSGPVFICGPRRRGGQVDSPTVDEHGVLNYPGEPARVPGPEQGAMFGVAEKDHRPPKPRLATRPGAVKQPAATSGQMPATLRAALDAKLAATRRARHDRPRPME